MAFPLAIVAFLLIVVGIRGTYTDFFSALKADMPGYLKWAAAFVLIGLVGYIPGLEKPSRLLLALVILAIVLSNKGVIANLAQTLSSPPAPSQAPASVFSAPLGPAPVTLTTASGTGSTGTATVGSASQGIGGLLSGGFL